MNILNLLNVEYWQPFHWASSHPALWIKTETVLYTWAVLCILAITLIITRIALTKKNSLARFSVVHSVENFIHMSNETLGSWYPNHIIFIGSLFIFIFFCNAIAIIPGLEEPTKDLNTTLSLGFIAFFYNQWFAIKSQGIRNYIASYFSPFFIMFPLNIIGKLASIISISFRLFGNIFGGATISHIYFGAIKGSLLWEMVGLSLGLNLVVLLFFGLFESFLQAFVFAMLSLTYLSISIHGQGH